MLIFDLYTKTKAYVGQFRAVCEMSAQFKKLKLCSMLSIKYKSCGMTTWLSLHVCFYTVCEKISAPATLIRISTQQRWKFMEYPVWVPPKTKAYVARSTGVRACVCVCVCVCVWKLDFGRIYQLLEVQPWVGTCLYTQSRCTRAQTDHLFCSNYACSACRFQKLAWDLSEGYALKICSARALRRSKRSRGHPEQMAHVFPTH